MSGQGSVRYGKFEYGMLCLGAERQERLVKFWRCMARNGKSRFGRYGTESWVKACCVQDRCGLAGKVRQEKLRLGEPRIGMAGKLRHGGDGCGVAG